MKFMKHKEKDFEIWLPIKTYPDFKISNWGRLYNKKTNRYLSGRPNTNGYWQVRLLENIKKIITIENIFVIFNVEDIDVICGRIA